jgi:hypothetical protein
MLQLFKYNRGEFFVSVSRNTRIARFYASLVLTTSVIDNGHRNHYSSLKLS